LGVNRRVPILEGEMAEDFQVALLVDFENLLLSVRDQFGEPVQWQRIIRVAEQQGRVVVRRVYADWSAYGHQQKDLQALGFELVHVGGHGKNAADLRLAIDAVHLAARKEPSLSRIILASGDGDFTDLAHYLRGQGLVVIGIGVRATTAVSLVAACDHFVYYDDLIEARRTPQTVERYLKALAPKVRMTISPYRPWIIVRAYRLIQQHRGVSLNVLKEKLPNYYQEHYPDIPQSVVNEILHQLFHTYCFEFVPPGREGPPLWERAAYLAEGIHSASDLLEHCDRGLLRILRQNLGGEPIDPVAATTLLYGQSENPQLVEHVRQLIENLHCE